MVWLVDLYSPQEEIRTTCEPEKNTRRDEETEDGELSKHVDTGIPLPFFWQRRCYRTGRQTDFRPSSDVLCACMRIHEVRRLAGPLLLAAILLTSIAWFRKGRLVPPDEIETVLLREPVQVSIQTEPFSFEYKNRLCRVEPVARWEQWGLVVSHNNIKSVADIYHDSSSVDTKDLCLIWGANLQGSDYQRVDFKSGPWTCYFSYGSGVEFHHQALGNNHLITDDSAVRHILDEVRVGDQVHLSGLLVNYQMEDWQGFWRRTSTSRTDSDCEVVFLEEIEILKRGTPGWYTAYRTGWLLILSVPVLYIFLMWLEAGNTDSSTLGRL